MSRMHTDEAKEIMPSWPSDLGACRGDHCIYRRGCARFLGHLISVWEDRSRQAYMDPQTPGILCPETMALQGREGEHLNSLYKELAPQLSMEA